MAKYRIFDPTEVSLAEVQERIEKNADLVTRCELAAYLRDRKKSARWITVLSYCISTALSALDDVRIASDQSGPSNSTAFEVKLAEIEEKLRTLEATPKETKTYKALLESLKRQRAEYQKLVDYGDVPKDAHKQLATLDLMLKRMEECIEKLGNDGVTYEHLLLVFPRLSKFMEV